MMINRIEVAIDRSLEKLHMDVKERRVPSISMGHDRNFFLFVSTRISSQGSLEEGLAIRSRGEGWWAWAGSNCRPHDYQSCALAS